jgi:hypothetical protein
VANANKILFLHQKENAIPKLKIVKLITKLVIATFVWINTNSMKKNVNLLLLYQTVKNMIQRIESYALNVYRVLLP